ncbi:MAG: DUF1987 domain-containing protein [Bacteroidia bacterium]|jgi:hypothetical protein|nr:DUF1987 domain-containing protein [Bacteroidia bacterium]
MSRLFIPGTNSTAQVDFDRDAGTMSITGVSIPENADQFFKPLHEWADTLIKSYSGNIKLTLCLTYFNTTTVRHLLPFMQRLIQHFRNSLAVVWQYEEDDEELLERGEELSDVLQFKFEYEALPVED